MTGDDRECSVSRGVMTEGEESTSEETISGEGFKGKASAGAFTETSKTTETGSLTNTSNASSIYT